MPSPAPAPQIEFRPVAALKPYDKNARRHSRPQVRQIADSIRRFGFTNPVLITDGSAIVAGHGRVMAAKELGMESVPTLRLSNLSPDEVRAYVIADNKLALNAGWDFDILADELLSLGDLGFDLSLTGFSLADIDLVIDQKRERAPETSDALDDLPPAPTRPVSRPGDLWLLGRHRLICGDAREKKDLETLIAVGKISSSLRPDLIFDIPANSYTI